MIQAKIIAPTSQNPVTHHHNTDVQLSCTHTEGNHRDILRLDQAHTVASLKCEDRSIEGITQHQLHPIIESKLGITMRIAPNVTKDTNRSVMRDRGIEGATRVHVLKSETSYTCTNQPTDKTTHTGINRDRVQTRIDQLQQNQSHDSQTPKPTDKTTLTDTIASNL